jgi:hypothetical protein
MGIKFGEIPENPIKLVEYISQNARFAGTHDDAFKILSGRLFLFPAGRALPPVN